MNKTIVYIFFLVIFSLKLFDAVIASSGILKNVCYAYMAIAIIMAIPSFFEFKGGFVLPVQLLCGSIVVSIFMSQYSWGQGISYAPTSIPYLIWFAFFYLLKTRIPIKTVEKIIIIYGILYMVLFLYQFTHTNVVYFGYHTEFKEDRGIIRVGFPGAGVFFLSCYMAVNKITSNYSKYKYLWITYAVAGIVINVLQVTRQAILVMLLMYLIHFMRNVKLAYKVLTIAVFVIAAIVFLNSDNPISKGLAEQQKTDASAGKDYIRLVAAKYFLTEFTPTTASKILGNGMFNNTSNYGKTMVMLSEHYGYFITDVGVVEIYVLFGVFAILAYIIMFVKSFRITVPRDYMYLKYYLWTLLLTCFTADSLISPSFIITTVLVLYCFQRFYEYNNIILNRQRVTPNSIKA